ncbi:exo-alpha-sialidase [Trebonia kvetii]|uniref:Exo-alpha-sialidase n=1 Tax=Trebonia kvetii TaxID=2480626 RepID=A0A6P2C680_9ACTN|nr:sialidase family protein [Trebonia kvetii]TVZ06788.1 exo-alpha-sialidase [Trebonia kvetii]
MTSNHNPFIRINESLSRRALLRGGVVAAALAALPSCDATAWTTPSGTASTATASPASRVTANVRVSRDQFSQHVGPSLAANPRQPGQLLVACQGSPFTPEFVLTYVSADGGATWQLGGRPPQPGSGPAGDDVTVASGGNGTGYVCAARSGHGSRLGPANPDANRAVYVWRTGDGGRTFSAPVTLVEGVYSDHPWVAAGQGGGSSGRHVYVAWGAGAAHTALEFTRSTDGGQTFATPRRILAEASAPSLVSAGPQVAAGPDGVVCVVCDWTTKQDASGDMTGQVTAVCSADGGDTFGAPVHLGAETATMALPGGVRPNSGPAVAISPRGDAIFVAFPVRKPGATHSDIVVTVSRDRGRSWTAPVTATPADGAIYFQPNLAADAAGRVAISAFALKDGRMDEVLLISRPGQLSFDPPLRVTTAPFDPLDRATATRGKYGIWWLGDWQGIASGDGVFHLVWNDTRTGKLDLFAATLHP